MTRSETIGGLATAFIKFKSEHPQVTLDEEVKVPTKRGNEYTFRFASLPQVKEKVDPFLNSNGLAVMQLIDGFNLVTMLVHSSGDFIEAALDLNQLKQIDEHGVQVNSGPQEFGAIVTYARRYAYCAILNIIGDGGGDSKKTTSRPAQRNEVNGSSAPARAQSNNNSPDLKWLNRGTPEWQAALDYLTIGDGAGKPSLEYLLTLHKINKDNREELLAWQKEFQYCAGMTHFAETVKAEINKAESEPELKYIFSRYIKLQGIQEFKDSLNERSMILKRGTVHA